MKQLLYLFILMGVLCSCEKDLSLEGAGEYVPPPPVFPHPEPVDTAPVFQLKAFYSDVPIDFDETDGDTKKETDLWKYVMEHVKDDHHILRNDTLVEVLQNAVKRPGMGDEILYKSYKRGQDDLGDFLVYLTPDYQNAKYRLYEWSDNHFVIGLKWKDGARVYSRFERIK